MSNPVIKEIEQKTYTISHAQYRELGEQLEKVERGIAVATTILYLLRGSQELQNYLNSTIEYGVWQAATDLEDRFENLEKYVSSLSKPDQEREESE